MEETSYLNFDKYLLFNSSSLGDFTHQRLRYLTVNKLSDDHFLRNSFFPFLKAHSPLNNSYLPFYFLKKSFFVLDYQKLSAFMSVFYRDYSSSNVSTLRYSLSSVEGAFFNYLFAHTSVRFTKFSGVKIAYGAIYTSFETFRRLETDIQYSPFIKKNELNLRLSREGRKKNTVNDGDMIPYLQLACENFIHESLEERIEIENTRNVEAKTEKLVLFVASDIHKVYKESVQYRSLAKAIEKIIINPLVEKNVKVVFCPSGHITRNVFKPLNLTAKSTKDKEVLKDVISLAFNYNLRLEETPPVVSDYSALTQELESFELENGSSVSFDPASPSLGQGIYHQIRSRPITEGNAFISASVVEDALTEILSNRVSSSDQD